VPDPTLRCQLDLDFLVDERQLEICQGILAKSGYRLAATTETTWEFKAGGSELVRIEDHYRARPQRSVELHFSSSEQVGRARGRDERLERLAWRSWNGVTFPALSDGDLFVGQALHVFGHLRGSCTRLGWLLEYRNHVATRRNDEHFWDEVVERSARYPQAAVGIGLVTLMTSQLFGIDSPHRLDSWTLEALPSPIMRWAEVYGRQALLADFPGTKLYLILEEQLALCSNGKGVDMRKSLIPTHRAPRIIEAAQNDGWWRQIRKEMYQTRFVLFRLRFHLVEGLRYLIESRRWKKLLNHNTQPMPSNSAKASMWTKG
jgi:hypothetical protein